MIYEANIISKWETLPDGTVAPLFDRLFQHDEWEDITVQDIGDTQRGEIVVLRVVLGKSELEKMKKHPQHHCLWCRPEGGQDLGEGPEVVAVPDVRRDTFLAGLPNVGFVKRGRTREEVAKRLRVLLRTRSLERTANL